MARAKSSNRAKPRAPFDHTIKQRPLGVKPSRKSSKIAHTIGKLRQHRRDNRDHRPGQFCAPPIYAKKLLQSCCQKGAECLKQGHFFYQAGSAAQRRASRAGFTEQRRAVWHSTAETTEQSRTAWPSTFEAIEIARTQGTRLAWFEYQEPGMTKKILEGPGIARDGLKLTYGFRKGS